MGQRLFIGGLSFSTSSERLREVFAAIGAVTQATVVTDQATGRSRGFGFVEMDRVEDAQQAISRLNGQDLDGRQIKVEMAKPSERSGGGRREGGGGGGGGRSRGGRW
jgi:RNA recognition motif-containing protein